MLANIQPSNIRRSLATQHLISKSLVCTHSLLSDILQDPPPNRLEKRRYIWDQVKTTNKSSDHEMWKKLWNENPPTVNSNLVPDPTVRVTGFDLERREWCTLNRFRTNHGRCNYLMHKWNYRDDPSCDCGNTNQTIVGSCNLRSYPGGIEELNKCTPSGIDWLKKLNISV